VIQGLTSIPVPALIGIGGSHWDRSSWHSPRFALDEILPFFVDIPTRTVSIRSWETDGNSVRRWFWSSQNPAELPETRNGMLEVEKAYKAAELNFAEHAVAVTQLAASWTKPPRRMAG